MPEWIRCCLSSHKPIRLRSVGSKSLLIQATLVPAHTDPIEVTSLVDSGCSARAFADRSFVKTRNIATQPTPTKRALLLADGKAAGSISEYFIAPILIGLHKELCLFFVTDLSPDTPIILGLPWLQRHNPSIDWSSMSLTFTSPYCHNFCCPQGVQNASAPVLPDPPSDYHDLPIPGEPARRVSFDLPTPGKPARRVLSYQPPTVKDSEDDDHSNCSNTLTYQSPTVEDSEDDSGNCSNTSEDAPGSTIEATPIPSKPARRVSFHLPPTVIPSQPARRVSFYQPPTVEDLEDDSSDCPNTSEDAPVMTIGATLTPGANHYHTRTPKNHQGPECRAQMIPNQPRTKPTPTRKTAGSRHTNKPPPRPPLPPLSVPLPNPSRETALQPSDRPDLSNIRLTSATNFVQFCRDPTVEAMKMTWDELDRLDSSHQQTKYRLPDLPEEYYKMVVLGITSKNRDFSWKEARQLFPNELHDFVDECYSPARLAKITDADIEKFMKGKPERTADDVLKKLPIWLRDLYDVFLPKLADKLPPQRSWDHKIELLPGKEPPYQKTRPMNPQELKVIRKWLDDNLAKGFIRESRARCAAPLLLAAKPGGGVRICQDYRGLNNITIKNRYPLPLIRETLDALCNAKVYTKLDIIAAFNNIRIAEGDIWKTAFITRFGLFETLVMPFGLCNAPATFQNYINHTLFDLLDKFCTAYLDDILIYSTDKKQHREHVREVVTRLRDAGLQIDIDKCEFETTRTKYLGLIVTPGGVEMDPEKVSTILNWEPPPALRDLQRFLGFANFYRRFIRDFSKITRPLNDLLKKSTIWSWEVEHQTAFDQLKAAFSMAPVLALYDYNRKTVLETDASDWASGGVLSQYDDEGVLRPVAYFSSKHSAQECNYEIYDKELLAIIKALEEWRPELQGTQEPFEVITDHKNLEYFTTTKALNQRQVRWSEFLSGFNFRIVYRPGTKAVRPDALSRRSEDRPKRADINDDRIKNRQRTILPEHIFDPEALAELTREINEEVDLAAAPIDVIMPAMDKPIDELIDRAYENSEMAQDMLTALRDASTRRRWPKKWRKELRVAMADCAVIGNRIYYRGKLFIPPNDQELKTQVIYRTHSTGPAGHPGRIKTIDLVSRTYWWPRITRDIEEYVKACELCDRVKASRSAPPGFLQPLPVPFQAWSDISIDYITPLPECERDGKTYQHVLVVVCRLTKMRHFIPVVSLTAEELASVFISRVYCLHGTPDNIISDRGSQFISEFWRQLSDRLGVRLRHSSAFHPETDGQTERINAGVEQYLRAFMNFHQDDWVDWLPLAEFAANNVTSETTGVSPFFANYGFHPKLGTEPTKLLPPNQSAAQRREFLKANNIADRFERIITQLKALATQAARRYEENANVNREDAPQYAEGLEVYISTKNMKTNRPMKKGDDKWAGPFPILKVYPRSCLVKLPEGMKIFPVFHNSLLRPKPEADGLPGQDRINEAESKNIRGRVLERDDETGELVEKWLFDGLLDSRRDADGLHYLVKWKHYDPTWQPAKDLKGHNQVLLEFHRVHPNKPGPPAWAKK
jgi:RNase H-like domain found in reverse transcriptase/Reverse transcriptase (RNA-dependent DNA polymerase)/Integrase zinc binding domain